MKHIISSIYFFSISHFLLGQIVHPFKFKNFEPNWYYFTQTDRLPLDSNFQSYEPEHLTSGGNPLVIHEGAMYPLYNIIGEYFNGYLLEKIDLQTGKKVWEDGYYSNKKGQRRYAQYARIKERKLELTVYYEDSLGEIIFYPFWLNAAINTHGYELDSGDKIYDTRNLPGDSTKSRLSMPDRITFRGRAAIKAFPFDEGYRYLYTNAANTRIGTDIIIGGHTLTVDQKLIDKKELSFSVPNSHSFLWMNGLDENKFVLSLGTNKNDSVEAGLFYLVFNPDLNLLVQKDLTNELDSAEIHSIGCAREDYMVIGSFNYEWYERYRIAIVQKMYLYNLAGQKLGEWDLKGLQSVSTEPSIAFSIIFENNNPRILFVNNSVKDGFRSQDFYLTGPNGKYEWVKQLIIEDSNHVASVRAMHQAGENIICEYHYKDFNSKPSGPANLNAFVSIPSSEFSLKTNTKDLVDNISSISLIPNPASDLITVIDFDEESAICLITNSLGQEVASCPLINNTISIAHLKPGIYFVKLIGNNKATTTLQFLKQ